MSIRWHLFIYHVYNVSVPVPQKFNKRVGCKPKIFIQNLIVHKIITTEKLCVHFLSNLRFPNLAFMLYHLARIAKYGGEMLFLHIWYIFTSIVVLFCLMFGFFCFMFTLQSRKKVEIFYHPFFYEAFKSWIVIPCL